jgi:hypothetical protein
MRMVISPVGVGKFLIKNLLKDKDWLLSHYMESDIQTREKQLV